MRQILEDSAQRAIAYLEGLENRRVAPDPASIESLTALDGCFPETPSDPNLVLQLLDEVGSPATMAMAGPRFFGFVIGGSLPVALAANWLAGAWDQNSAYFKVTPSTAALEQIALGWLFEIFGLPPTSGARS